MPQQFESHVEGRFALFGEEYELVTPSNLEELIEAFHIRDLLQQGIDANEPDSGHPYYYLQREQENRIGKYISKIGEFDNTLFIKNLAYLTKQNGIRIGDLEKVLGISTGYISRTAKENSGRKMSIDNVWKIARLFGVELRALLETDLQMPNKNTELIARFLDKLRQQTEDNKITWRNCGGACCQMDSRLSAMSYFVEDENSNDTIYKVAHLNPQVRFTLADDIYSCQDIDPQREFLMVAYSMADRPLEAHNYHVDFYFAGCSSTHLSEEHFTKAFYTLDDCHGTLDTYARMLMHSVQEQEMDSSLSPEVKNIIKGYLS